LSSIERAVSHPLIAPDQAREALKRFVAGKPLREIALSCNVEHSTIHFGGHGRFSNRGVGRAGLGRPSRRCRLEVYGLAPARRGGFARPRPDRKKTRHCGESCDFFWIMQAVMASTFGTNSPHSRIASGWQACCCSGV
jgi:hypothetical protein